MKIEFTPTDVIGRDFPPIPMKKVVPEWYKNLPVDSGEKTAIWYQKTSSLTTGTIKKCVPVMDYMTSGYALRTQTEILLSSLKSSSEQTLYWQHASSDKDTITHHPHAQCPIKIQNESKAYIKLRCGFIIKTPPGYSCIFYQSPYFMHEGVEFFPAVVDTDTYDGEVFFPGYITAGYENITLPPGTPIMSIFPFKREKWESVVCEKSQDSLGEKFKAKQQVWLSDIYRKFFHQTKEYK
jgi:hypothetical protein